MKNENLRQIDELGRVVIPTKLLSRYGLKAGDVVAFSAYEKEYYNFIKTITDNPDDIEACQSAFNDLATAYIYGEEALLDVTEESKDAVVAMLKQKGVANALEVVNSQLASNTYALADAEEERAEAIEAGVTASLNVKTATLDEVGAFIAESKQVGVTTSDIAYYAAIKVASGKYAIDTTSDLQNLALLCDSLGLTGQALEDYNYAKTQLERLETDYQLGRMTQSTYEWAKKNYMNQLKEAGAGVADMIKDYINANAHGEIKIDIEIPNGEETDLRKTFDWIELFISRLQAEIEALDHIISSTFNSWDDRMEASYDKIDKLKEEKTVQGEAAGEYLDHAADLADKKGVSDYFIDIQNGTRFDIQDNLDADTFAAIQEVQAEYDKYLAACKREEEINADIVAAYRERFDLVSSEYAAVAKAT